MSKNKIQEPSLKDIFNLVVNLKNDVGEIKKDISRLDKRIEEVHERIDEVNRRVDEVHGRIDYYHKSRKIDKFDELYGLKEVLALDIIESKNLKWANEIIEKNS